MSLMKTLPSSDQAALCLQRPALKLHACSSSSSVTSLNLAVQPSCKKRLCVCAAAPSQDLVNTSLTGVVFQPFVEVEDYIVKVPSSPSESLARQVYSPACEAAINEQINVEYNASYVYHNLFAYFDRDNVALPGFAKFFKESSDEEREHAEKLMKYQNIRGGRVKLMSVIMPPITEFDDVGKGDALYAMEFTLALEKLVNEKLLKLHKVAADEGDAQLTDYIEGEFLKQQVEDIKKVASYVSQLRRELVKAMESIILTWNFKTARNNCKTEILIKYL